MMVYKIDSAIVLMLLLNFLVHCNADESYTVPEPQIEILRPKGLKVSIPHEPGIELFAFHGNINKEMNGLEAGYFSKDILKRDDNNGRWIFYDPNAKLKNGDTLYYWLFVIKNKLGYRYDNGVFEIKADNTQPQENNAPAAGGGGVEASTKVPLSCCPTTATTTDATIIFPIDIRIGRRRRGEIQYPMQDSNDKQKNGAFNSCQDLFDNQTATINKLSAEVEKLKEINRLLYDIGEKAAQAGRELRLTVGNKTATNVDPLVQARDVMKKMGLAVDVVKARIGRRGDIVFEVKNVRDKVKIIMAAKEKMRDSDIYLTY